MRSAALGIGVLAACAMLPAAAVDGPAAAGRAPPPFTAVYALEWHGLTAGYSTLSLTEPSPGEYVYSSVSRARGPVRMFFPDPISERSTFRIENGRVEPLEYQEDDGPSHQKQNVALQFDWKAKEVHGNAGTKNVMQPLEPGTQDPLSVQISLMRELAAGNSPTHFMLFDKTEAAEYHYTREGNVALDTPFGRLETVVYRSDRADSDRVMRFWLAPTLGYLPVRAERKRRGKTEFELRIRELTPKPEMLTQPPT
ncbi:MAG TPA: DUF3108 domain-containing protein [Steroidobacteraceae bacterium]|nr:DUF3108 domain-containing protein [Steroidobacteraceae bacterium]